MIAVLDVSAALDLLLHGKNRERFGETYGQASWVLAPDLYTAEISNVFWKYHKAGVLTHNECIQYVDDGISLVDDFVDTRELWKEALGEGIRNSHSVYDMYYLTLARRNDATLLTNDSALTTICQKLKIQVCN